MACLTRGAAGAGPIGGGPQRVEVVHRSAPLGDQVRNGIVMSILFIVILFVWAKACSGS